MDPTEQQLVQPVNNQPIDTQPPPELHPNQRNTFNWTKKSLVIIAILIVLGIGVGGYYFGTRKNESMTSYQQAKVSPTSIHPPPAPNPTVGWKTYTSKDGLFSFKLPQDWQVTPFPDTSTEHITIQNKQFTLPPNSQTIPSDVIIAKVIEAPTTYFRGYTITEDQLFDPTNKFWFKGTTGGGEGTGTIYNTPQQVTINGKKAMFQSFSSGLSTELTNSYFFFLPTTPSQLVEVEIGVSSKDSNKSTDETTLNQILSSFKMLTQTTDASNWQTYTNSIYEVSFKYPLNWSSDEALLSTYHSVGFGPGNYKIPLQTEARIPVNVTLLKGKYDDMVKQYVTAYGDSSEQAISSGGLNGVYIGGTITTAGPAQGFSGGGYILNKDGYAIVFDYNVIKGTSYMDTAKQMMQTLTLTK